MPKVLYEFDKKSSGFPESPKVANLYIGIDPGASGGIAIIWEQDCILCSKAIKMPEEDMDILDFLLDLQGNIPLAPETVGINTHVCMEKVWGWVGGNKTQQPTKEKKSEGNPGSHMFQFGVNYGRIRMALRAVGMEPTLVAARTWQRSLGIAPRDKQGGESKEDFKRRLKAEAQRLFPLEDVTLATADALLVAYYCKMLVTGPKFTCRTTTDVD